MGAARRVEISFEGKVGIFLGLVGLAGAGAIMIAPEKLWIGWSLIGFAAIGCVMLFIHHFSASFRMFGRWPRALLTILAVGLGVWFESWYYSNYSANGGVWRMQIVMPSGVHDHPQAAPPTPPVRLQSTWARAIYKCAHIDITTKAISDFRNEMQVYGDAFGFNMKVLDVLGDDIAVIALRAVDVFGVISNCRRGYRF